MSEHDPLETATECTIWDNYSELPLIEEVLSVHLEPTGPQEHMSLSAIKEEGICQAECHKVSPIVEAPETPWSGISDYGSFKKTDDVRTTPGMTLPVPIDACLSTINKETFAQLSCFIDQEVRIIHPDNRNGFEDSRTKQSNILNREAVCDKTYALTDPPGYLRIPFVRSHFDEGRNIKAKILKNTKCPIKLDLFDPCSDAVQRMLHPTKTKLLEAADREASILRNKAESVTEKSPE